MKATKAKLCVGLIFALVLSASLIGCGDKNQSGLTIDEPEITVEYLENDYVEQLLRDGAEHVFGSVELIKNEDGSITVNIDAKEYVKDDNQPNGFYIEDRNYKMSSTLAQEARCTFLQDGVSIPQIMTTEKFVEAFNKDMEKHSTSNPDYKNFKLYDMYIMGDQIELMLERYIP
ncbi:MAG: hypothetical protein ACK5MV_03835 [Aminipila sp.]